MSAILITTCLVMLKLGSEVRMRLCAYIFTKLVVIVLVVKIGLFKVMRLQIFVVLHFQLYVFRAILLSQAQIPKFGYNRKVCIFAKRCRMRHKIQYHNCANASCVLRKAISYALRKNQKKMIKPDSFKYRHPSTSYPRLLEQSSSSSAKLSALLLRLFELD